jgi:hypothetical protein
MNEPAQPPAARNFSLADMPFMDPSFASLSECSNRETTAIREEFLATRPVPSVRRIRSDQKHGDSPGAALQRHRRKCATCNHPDREMIDFYFVRWNRPRDIAHDFGLPHVAAIYRPARALGLFSQRSRNLRAMLEHMFEKATCVFPTADSLVRACRTYSSLGENGEWIEPATTHIVKPDLPGHPALSSPGRAQPTRRPSAALRQKPTGHSPAVRRHPEERSDEGSQP